VLCLCRLSLSRARNCTSYDCTESRQEATSLGLVTLSPVSVACLCSVQPNCTLRYIGQQLFPGSILFLTSATCIIK
jgi:hypothetical protein